MYEQLKNNESADCSQEELCRGDLVTGNRSSNGKRAVEQSCANHHHHEDREITEGQVVGHSQGHAEGQGEGHSGHSHGLIDTDEQIPLSALSRSSHCSLNAHNL